MPLRQLFIAALVSIVIAWLAWGLVLFRVDPLTSGIPGRLVFFVSLFIALGNTASMLWLWAMSRGKDSVLILRHARGAFEQGFLFAALVLLSLLLHVFDLWSGFTQSLLMLLWIVLGLLFFRRAKR